MSVTCCLMIPLLIAVLLHYKVVYLCAWKWLRTLIISKLNYVHIRSHARLLQGHSGHVIITQINKEICSTPPLVTAAVMAWI